MTKQSWLTFVSWLSAPRTICLAGATISVPLCLLEGALPGRPPSSTATAALALVISVTVCGGAATTCIWLLIMTSGMGAGVVSGIGTGALMPSDVLSLLWRSHHSAECRSQLWDHAHPAKSAKWFLQHVGLTHSMDSSKRCE